MEAEATSGWNKSLFSGLRIFLLALSLDRGCRRRQGLCNHMVAIEGFTPALLSTLFPLQIPNCSGY
jgi:hypothetical protein